MKKIKRPPITIKTLLVFFSLLLTGCAQITVTGLIQGERDGRTVIVSNQQIKQGKIKTVDRVQNFQGQPFFDSVRNLAIQLSVSEINNPPEFNESYYYLVISSPKEEISGGESDDLNYIPNNIGKLSFLNVDQGEGRVEAAPQQLFDAHVGESWLVRVEDNDRKIPWLITDDNNCFPLEEGDCFDMESLSRLLFNELRETVESGVRANIPLVQNIHHRLHFVPQVSHSGVGSNRPAKGFGFIYYAEINLPAVKFQAYVPINFLFISDNDNYLIVIDPLELEENETQTIEQIYVKESLLFGVDLNITEQIIRDKIVEAIQSATLPNLIPGIEFSTTLVAAINGAAGNPATIPSNFNMILMPSGDNRDLDNTILWDQPVDGTVFNFNQVELFFLE